MSRRSVITLDHIRRRCPVCQWVVERDHEEALHIVEEARRQVYLAELFATFGDLHGEPLGLELVDADSTLPPCDHPDPDRTLPAARNLRVQQ